MLLLKGFYTHCACISTFWEPPPLPPEKPFEVAVSWIHFRFLLYIECINSTGNMSFQVSKRRIQSYIVLALDQQIVMEGRF